MIVTVGPRARTLRDARLKSRARGHDSLEISLPVLVDEIDEIDDRVGRAYSGMPDRLYVIDRQGKVAFKCGRGSFRFFPGKITQIMIMFPFDEGIGGQGCTASWPRTQRPRSGKIGLGSCLERCGPGLFKQSRLPRASAWPGAFCLTLGRDPTRGGAGSYIPGRLERRDRPRGPG